MGLKGFCRIGLAVWLLAACGYQFAGQGRMPAGVERVFVRPLENRTAETGLATVVTDAIRYEFVRAGKSGAADRAGAVLSGFITSIQIETATRRGLTTALEKRVQVTADLKLQHSDGRLLWQDPQLRADETYAVAADKMQTDQNLKVAIRLLARRLAEDLYLRLGEDF